MPQTYSPPSLKRRLAALIYEALLVGAVTTVASIIAGIVATVLNPISSHLANLAVTIILIYAWWLYFKTSWHKKGQTLAMQVWKIGLVNEQGTRPPLNQLRMRFLWACVFIIFIPLLVYMGMRHISNLSPKATFGMALIWWILPWGFAFLNRHGQFLYDYLAGTRLVNLTKGAEVD